MGRERREEEGTFDPDDTTPDTRIAETCHPSIILCMESQSGLIHQSPVDARRLARPSHPFFTIGNKPGGDRMDVPDLKIQPPPSMLNMQSEDFPNTSAITEEHGAEHRQFPATESTATAFRQSTHILQLIPMIIREGEPLMSSSGPPAS